MYAVSPFKPFRGNEGLDRLYGAPRLDPVKHCWGASKSRQVQGVEGEHGFPSHDALCMDSPGKGVSSLHDHPSSCDMDHMQLDTTMEV